MQLPRKGILIRIVVYGALLSYFGYQAWSRYAAEKAETEVQLPAPKKVQLPDGRSIEVIEVTPEQAAALSGSPAAFERGDAPAPAPEGAPMAAPEASGETPPAPTPEAAPAPTAAPDAPPAAPAAPTPAPTP